MGSLSMNHRTTFWKSQTSTSRWQADRLICRTGGKSRPARWSGLILCLHRLEQEKDVGQHHQSQMPMHPFPGASLRGREPTLALRILVELFDRPAQMRQFHQARQGRLSRQIAEKPLGFAFLSGKRTLCQQPVFGSGPAPSMSLTVTSVSCCGMNCLCTSL